MKPLMILMRIVLVGIFWSILFIEGIRTILLINWHFDIFRYGHWEHLYYLWDRGWVVRAPKEWAFVLIILTFIPLWLSGWGALSMIKWGRFFSWVMFFPLKFFNKIFEKQVKKIANTASVKVVKKRKSYKEIRPKSVRPPLESNSYNLPGQKSAAAASPHASLTPPSALAATQDATPAATTKFDHSLFQFDEEAADFDFDLFDDKPKTETPKPENISIEPQPAPPPPPSRSNNNSSRRENNRNDHRENNRNNRNNNGNRRDNSAPQPQAQATAPRSSNSTLDVLKQKGYEVITAATIKNTLIDFIGVSKDQICLCLNDKEPGDWLADEERFNDEEPLWFSESSHRISPVRKIDIARLILTDKLAEADLNFKINAFVIIQIGNIINAEDMFEIWNEMKIKVARIDRGTPKELQLFAKTLEDAETPIAADKFEKIKKLVRSIA